MNKILETSNIENLELKNRLVMPPMCMYSAQEDGVVSDFHLSHYGARAIGGVGLIIVEATAVEPRGRISNKDLILENKEQMESHKKLVRVCKELGAKMAIQIAHAGRKSVCTNTTPIAPSAIAFSNEEGYKLPKEITLDEIKDIKKAFVNSALLAKEAGYDALEIHGAHGYLLCEFLSPLTNRRSDSYGGSLENRSRLLLEIAKEVKEATKLPLIVRISATEWEVDGWDLEDSVYLTQELERVGVDSIDVSAGGNIHKPSKVVEFKPLYQVNYAKTIKESCAIPIITVGLITTAKECNEILEKNYADFVAIGRELLRNPNFLQYIFQEEGQSKMIAPQYLRAFI